MNILFLSQTVPYPPHGGVLQRGYNILREIAKNNEVRLLAFVHPDTLTGPNAVAASRERLGRFCHSLDYFRLWPKQSAVHRYLAFTAGLAYPLPFSTLAHRSRAFGRRLQEILVAERIDIVHFDTIGLAPYLSLVKGIPAVLTHHNIESSLMARRARVEKPAPARWYVRLQAARLRSYEKRISPLFDLNVMVSATDERELQAMAPSVRTVVVPNGVDTDYFAVQDQKQEKEIIYTGGLNMFANRDAVFHLINDIWPRIKAAHPDAVFTVIGQDPPADLLEIRDSDPSIRVLGYVDDVRPHVARAAVYVVPLRVGGGTRLKVLDALAQGKAIVSTSVGCEGIDVTDGVDICIADDDAVFAERVSDLFADDARRAELGRAARRLAEQRYGWSSIGMILQRAYDTVAERSRARGG